MNKVKSPASKPRRKKEGTPMVVILRRVPKGYDWGWFSREDPRMHLQTVDEQHRKRPFKVWLEEKGRRICEPAGEIPGKVLGKLREEVARDRYAIEDSWTVFMLKNNWLDLSLRGSLITLTAYPQFPGSRFTRSVDLADYLRGIYDPHSQLSPREKKPVKPDEVVLSRELNAIEIWPQQPESRRYHIYLPPILWVD